MEMHLCVPVLDKTKWFYQELVSGSRQRGRGPSACSGLFLLLLEPLFCLLHGLAVFGQIALNKGILHFGIAVYNGILDFFKGADNFFRDFFIRFYDFSFCHSDLSFLDSSDRHENSQHQYK